MTISTIIATAEELVLTCVIGIIALMLFTGGILLVFSIKPREYNSAIWMTLIAFFLLWGHVESIAALEISFLSAINILETIAVVFMLMAIFEIMLVEKINIVKIYKYIALAFVFIVIRILSQ